MKSLFVTGIIGLCASFWTLMLPGVAVGWIIGSAAVSWLLLMTVGASSEN